MHSRGFQGLKSCTQQLIFLLYFILKIPLWMNTFCTKQHSENIYICTFLVRFLSTESFYAAFKIRHNTFQCTSLHVLLDFFFLDLVICILGWRDLKAQCLNIYRHLLAKNGIENACAWQSWASVEFLLRWSRMSEPNVKTIQLKRPNKMESTDVPTVDPYHRHTS